jgi:hypothetical protein
MFPIFREGLGSADQIPNLLSSLAAYRVLRKGTYTGHRCVLCALIIGSESRSEAQIVYDPDTTNDE